ncbi:alpha-hydroxy-acid oxidizing protein [Micromonospora sp. R77]|uniref:alpha-hydroxy-acid oxidizing protein n=1 Tax=Micromonospora sp. R77 TaxID=2925836 RepID=UPI001F62308C|nr:alpha-hydroxy-acid oxidizing protein [Micromonospora sp. R77]MCI4066947.1 alpha-hydroxy-acid oxidizing protein [Micromonospora sp. R77]
MGEVPPRPGRRPRRSHRLAGRRRRGHRRRRAGRHRLGAPAFLGQVGLPLGECLRRIGRPDGCLLASGRIWEGGRAVRALAAGATAVGLGRAALLAVDTDADAGLVRLVEALALEARLLVSALGRYTADALTPEDLWWPGTDAEADRPVVPIGGRA